MTKKKAKQFWEEHKAAIIASATITVGAMVSIVLHRKLHNHSAPIATITRKVPKSKEIKLEIPEGLKKLGVDEWFALSGDVVEFTLPCVDENGHYPIKIKELRDMVDAICDIPGVCEESEVWALLSIVRDSE